MTPEIPGPAYRLETDRLVIRCWDPRDAPLLKRAIDGSREHLRQWMTWVEEAPIGIDEYIARLRRFRARFDSGEEYMLGMFDRDGSRVLGACGLHRRIGPDAFEIGYWIAKTHQNRGLATEATMALTRIGFEVEHVDRIEVRVAVGNDASMAVARKAGYADEGVLRRRLELVDGTRGDATIWTLFRDELPGTPAAALELGAFDAAGRRIL